MPNGASIISASQTHRFGDHALQNWQHIGPLLKLLRGFWIIELEEFFQQGFRIPRAECLQPPKIIDEAFEVGADVWIMLVTLTVIQAIDPAVPASLRVQISQGLTPDFLRGVKKAVTLNTLANAIATPERCTANPKCDKGLRFSSLGFLRIPCPPLLLRMKRARA